MTLSVNLPNESYNITVEHGALSRAGELFDLDRKVLIVTDDGVPRDYVNKVSSLCREVHVVSVRAGEESKSLSSFELLCRTMLEAHFSRRDCVVAVGGGMPGDLAGFAASAYMRGVDFYNIPTTLLSQVDSSIGGKTAVNLGHVKNIVGAFYQPKGVLIDPDTLKTLTPRLFSEGLAEVIKMAATDDEALFSLLENEDAKEHLEEIIVSALKIKKYYVENDEKEAGMRAVLNFGHTVGHAVEAQGSLYHGECVALGMLYMSEGDAKKRILSLLKKYGLPTEISVSPDVLYETLCHDKKASDGTVKTVRVEKIGTHTLSTVPLSEMKTLLQKSLR